MTDKTNLIEFKGKEKPNARGLLDYMEKEVGVDEMDEIVVIAHMKSGELITISNTGSSSGMLWLVEHAKMNILLSDSDL